MKTAFGILVGALAALGLLTTVGGILVACSKPQATAAQVEASFAKAEKIAESPGGEVFEFSTRRGYCYVYEAKTSSKSAISCFR